MQGLGMSIIGMQMTATKSIIICSRSWEVLPV